MRASCGTLRQTLKKLEVGTPGWLELHGFGIKKLVLGTEAAGGARETTPMHCKIFRITCRWSITAMMAIRPPQSSHCRTSIRKTRFIKSAHVEFRREKAVLPEKMS